MVAGDISVEGGTDGHALVDEELKQTIAKVEDALEALRKMEALREEDPEVEAHGMHWSDAELKQTIGTLESALQALRKIEAAKA